MNEEPPRLPPPLPPVPTTRVPRVFNIQGTLVYAGCSFTAFCFMIAMGFGIWPPWYVILPCLFYVFLSSGIIAHGRIEANKDARFFIHALKKRSQENKQREMRRMN
jgi:hypothetical protein